MRKDDHSCGGSVEDLPHRRYNPLLNEWVLVSPQRALRPWHGAVEGDAISADPAYDPECYLCPGNFRAGGDRNPDYVDPYVFKNDFPALLAGHSARPSSEDKIFKSQPVSGEARVICYSKRHDLSMARLPEEELRKIVVCWEQQYRELSQRYSWVSIFENKGAAMGCSSPHPHGQVWASNYVPTEVAKEDHFQREYFNANGKVLLLDYARKELDLGKRVIFQEGCWICVVPYWATWPFEALLLPTDHISDIGHLNESNKTDLAKALKRLTVKYDNLFQTPFPYSMGWHGRPPGDEGAHWLLHCHFYPPLLRSASIRKFMVGFELLSEAQRDLTPEAAAETLRAVSEIHYTGMKQNIE